MNNSYQFFGVDYLKAGVIFAVLLILACALSIGFVMGAVFFFKDFILKNDVMIFLAVAMIILFLALLYIIYLIAVKYTGEQWHISFNSESIEMGSNKREQKIFPISQLNTVTLFKEEQALGAGYLSILISFEKKESSSAPFHKKIRINVYTSLFSGSAKKENFNVFSRFLDNFKEQFLHPKFELTSSRKQRSNSFGSGHRLTMPSKLVFTRMD